MTFDTLASSSPSRVAGNHTACSRLTVGAIALVLSVDYRSHRPPAAIGDVGTVLFYPTLSEPGFFYPTVWTEPPAPGSG
jgi:hypothetical protein